MTDQPASLAAALADLQQHLPRIQRTAEGQAGTRRYKYPPYDAILRKVRPVLLEHGFLWTTKPTLTDAGRFVLIYQLTHLATGLKVGGAYPLTEGAAQAQGAQISYAKRYTLVAVLDLEVVGEDDDAMPERTPAKIPGPEHERLRYGTVENTPDDKPTTRVRSVDKDPVDKWTDQPTGNFDIGTPEDHPGSIDDRQLKDLQIKFRKLGIDDRGVRLGMVSDWLGRSVLSANQLSRIEAAEVIRQLDKRLAAEETGA